MKINDGDGRSIRRRTRTMDELVESFNGTLRNLKDKRDFLEEQKEHYIGIRRHLLDFDKKAADADNPEDNKGMVFGDIIIAAQKLYLNIGYEYFVEKSCHELVDFVDSKLQLMEDAVVQFNEKISEANKTLENLEHFSRHDDDTGSSDYNESLPSVEIREELDEDGNVIKGTVTPTSSRTSIQSGNDNEELNSFEKSLKGRLFANKDEKIHNQRKDVTKDHSSEPVADEDFQRKNFEKDIARNANSERIDSHNDMEKNYNGRNGHEQSKDPESKIDLNNMYTFADLVRQLDEQDALEDEEFSGEEHTIDIDAFELSSNDDGDEDYGENVQARFTMIPGLSAQEEFMRQIENLRQKEFLENKQHDTPENYKKYDEQHVKKGKDIQLKSILKKNHQIGTKKPKSVGFATKLDIKEVESFKEQNKRNTQRFAVPYFLQESMDTNIHDVVGENANEEFDGDLFTKLIGAQGPDEVHSKYKNNLEEEETAQKSHQMTNKKSRVSRFKKERGNKNMSGNLYQGGTRTSEMEDLVVDERLADAADKVIHEVCERQTNETVSDETVERSSKDFESLSNIVENPFDNTLSNSDGVMEHKGTPLHSPEDNRQLSNSEEAGKMLESSLFAKKMKSLAYPRKNVIERPKVDLSILNSMQPFKEERGGKRKQEQNSDHDIGALLRQKSDNVETITLQKPTVDFRALSDDIDDMAQAYSLGVYDDDLEEDPGVIIEKIEDFEEHNKQVDILKDEIENFKINNALDDTEWVNSSKDSNQLMFDIQENEIPENYSAKDDSGQINDEDLSLEYGRLTDSIAIEYARLRTRIHASRTELSTATGEDNDQRQFEPIDEFGNPVKVSRFKSERVNI